MSEDEAAVALGGRPRARARSLGPPVSPGPQAESGRRADEGRRAHEGEGWAAAPAIGNQPCQDLKCGGPRGTRPSSFFWLQAEKGRCGLGDEGWAAAVAIGKRPCQDPECGGPGGTRPLSSFSGTSAGDESTGCTAQSARVLQECSDDDSLAEEDRNTDALRTVMVKNLWCRLTAAGLTSFLNSKGYAGSYESFYMPVRKSASNLGTNRGFCFITFKTAEDAWRLLEEFHKKPAGLGTTRRVLKVSFAHYQEMAPSQKGEFITRFS